jgi:hypothetical protein
MAFIVENGSVVPNATAYISIDELDLYWLDRNVTLTETILEKQAAIIIATQYVDLNNNWRGRIISEEQSLDFPRSGVYDDERRGIENDVVPKKLKYAIAEYARRQLVANIQPDVPTETGAIISKRDKIGDLESQIQYAEGSTGYYGIKRFPLADRWLIGLNFGGVKGDFGRLIRD